MKKYIKEDENHGNDEDVFYYHLTNIFSVMFIALIIAVLLLLFMSNVIDWLHENEIKVNPYWFFASGSFTIFLIVVWIFYVDYKADLKKNRDSLMKH